MRAYGNQPNQLAAALDGAWIILTTYRVLKQEVLYRGGAAASDGDTPGGSPDRSGSLRKHKRYAVPSSPLLMRSFHRLVIDEAQAVQTRTATASQLGLMASRISATHRWCVTGTPLSEERGLIDGYDLLRFLGSTHPLAGAKRAFSDALNHPTGRPALVALLRHVTWRCSKAAAYAQLRIPHPMPHHLRVTLSSSERAWAARDVREMGGEVLAELPPPPLGPSPPPPAADAADAAATASAASSSVDNASPAPADSTANSTGNCTGAADGTSAARSGGVFIGPLRVPNRFELQRAMSHVQLGRAWIGLGRSEAQLETGTSIVDLEQLQRAAEVRARPARTGSHAGCLRLRPSPCRHHALNRLSVPRAPPYTPHHSY